MSLDATILGSGRMRFAGGAETPVYGLVLGVGAGGDFQYGDGAVQGGIYYPAFWDRAPQSPLVSGLVELVPSVLHPGHYDGVRTHGTGTVHVGALLSPLLIFGGMPDDEVGIDFQVARNGVPLYTSVVRGHVPDWVLVMGGDHAYSTDLEADDGDIFTAGFTIIPSLLPQIGTYPDWVVGAYTGGAANSTVISLSGSLVPPGEEPSFAMRGSGVVG